MPPSSPLPSPLPSIDECLALLARHGQSTARMAHCRAVADAAAALAGAAGLDAALARAAGLLHDIAKGRPDHGAAGGQILDDLGYPVLAHIARLHIGLMDDHPLDETAVVFLADKMIDGPDLVGLDRRFARWIARCAERPDILSALHTRLARARAVKEALERRMGRSVEDVLGAALE